MSTPQHIYQRCIEFEERAAEIYLKLASHFSPQNSDLGALWLEMGIQEKQHAGLLQFCLAEQLFARNLPSGPAIRAIASKFRNLEKRAADPRLDVDGAFSLAVEMEASEINDIYERLTTPVHRSMYLVQRKIATSIPDHVDRLFVAGKRFGVSRSILEKLERLPRKHA